jgi:3-phosphoshikimate 1-carboxyvinyltransferase
MELIGGLTTDLLGATLNGEVILPAGKSESNRALMLTALSRGLVIAENLSDAEDTVTMNRILADESHHCDVGDAGTVMRFLTAYFAFQPRDVMITGSPRMKERPIALLVDALRTLGADIYYPEREGYPPLAIYGLNAKFGESHVCIPGNVSSQYLSALLMIAPQLPDGLTLEITGELFSAPYLAMTIAMMKQAGIVISQNENMIRVERQNFHAAVLSVEADWSAAAYFYFMLAQAGKGEIFLKGLRENSLQADHVVSQWMLSFGIQSQFSEGGVRLTCVSQSEIVDSHFDFRHCPDMAQGFIVFLASRGISATFSGLESLRIKETDRIDALDTELRKFNVSLVETDPGKWMLQGTFSVPQNPVAIETYGDHRMAMAFAQLGFLKNGLVIQFPEVVKKSFPQFWTELEKIKNG